MTDAERIELARLRQIEADEQKTPNDLLAEQAWNAIRKPVDNEFVNLPMEIRHKLIDLTEKALAGKQEQEGDYAPEGFFQQVRDLSGETFAEPLIVEDVEAAEVVDEVPAEPPTFGEKVKDFFSDPFGTSPKPFDGNERRVGVAERRVEDLTPEAEKRSGLVDRRDANVSQAQAPPKELKGPLPEDFPGRAALADADVNTYHQLRKRIEAGTLTLIPHVGPALAAKIEARLSE